MADELKPVVSQPGVVRIPDTSTEYSPGSGMWSLEGGVETSTGSGIWAFPAGPAFELTTTSVPPTVRLAFDESDLPGSTHTLVVSRTHDGITETVRSAWALFAAGGAVLTDSEVPVGVSVSYAAEAFDADGNALGKTEAVTAFIDSDPATGWISDPTNPNLVVRVSLLDDFADTLSTVRQVQTYQVGNRVVALLGSLGKLQNINIRVRTDTVEDGQTLALVLAQTSVLIRTSPPADVPRLLYVIVPEVNKTGTGGLDDIQFGGGAAIWQGTGQEVSTTTLDILVPLVTWQTYIDAFSDATWADVIAIYSGTWLDAIENPPGV